MASVNNPQATPLIQLLDTIGDGTGNKSANGNYLTTATTFKAKPANNRIWFVDFIKVQLTDSGVFYQQGYGATNVPLVNGFTITIYKSGIAYNLTPALIKTNDHFNHYSFEYTDIPFQTAYSTINAVLRFDAPFILCGNQNDRIEIVLHDDFTYLVDQTFVVHGKQLII